MHHNNRKANFICMWLTLWRKKVLLEFVSFYWFDKKRFVLINLNFMQYLPFSNMLRKTNFLSIPVIPSVVVIFVLKIEVLCEFSRKCFKTTEKHSLAECDSLWGEKQFLLEFDPFYWFDQRELYKPILILLRIYPFQRCCEKQIYWVFQCSFLR